MFHPLWREAALDALKKPFDLVVVGGGINGCGIFFDAAQRGLRVLLVEREDLAAGTSGRSSKLIHGGLRYLKQMQLRVTRTSCQERDRLARLNPHLVDPIRFVYPTFRDGPPAWPVDLGLWLYDQLTESSEKHSDLTPEELRRLVPGLPRHDVLRALSYFDARADDARLTWAVAASGFVRGGHLLTRAELEDGVRDADGRLVGVVLRDLLSGATHRVEAALVVNATGAWGDRVRLRLGAGEARLKPSRGSHLLFPAERLPLEAALTVPSPDDGRPVFFIPHPEGVLLGTTDLFHDDEIDDPRPTNEEIGYLLRAAAAAFPANPPKLAEATGCFAGVRPVVADEGDDPAKASREEAIWEERGLLTVAGGKLTTWRLTAEEAVDLALRYLPAEIVRRAAPCATASTPLVGHAPATFGDRLASFYGASPEVARAMARRLGALAWTACELWREPADLRPLADGLDLCAAELRAHLRFGAVLHLSDLLLRRVRLGMWRPADVEAFLPALEPAVRAAAGWDAKRFDEERERYARDVRGWTLAGVAKEGRR